MSRISCRIQETYIYNDEGREVEGVIATCPRCGRETHAYGRSDGSVRRCMRLMKEECRDEDRGTAEINDYSPE